jgi:hypothetical protein
MEPVLKKDAKVKISEGRIEVDNLIFHKIESYSSLRFEQLIGYDALILDAQDLTFVRFLIRKLRAHFNPEYFLKPIFLLNPRETQDPIIKNLSDGIIFSIDQVKDVSNLVKQIYFRSTQLDHAAPPSFEGQIMKKVLDYMYTRDVKSLTPHVDMNSAIGYTWPEISVNFESHEESQAMEILEWAEKEGFIWPDFQDRIYLCNNCSCGYLMYREVCPHCNSANINSEDLVHHFPCAHVAPLSDFKNKVDNTLVCPKCSKSLRHIGVDYDKPSVINHCNSCDKSFQDFYIKAKCLSCRQDVDVQLLISKAIFNYKLTKKGRAVAVNGIFSTNSELEDIFGTIGMETYKVMMHYQLERVRNNPSLKSYMAVYVYENIFELYNRIGNKAYRKLLEDVISIMREGILTSDYICIENPSTIHVCLNDVDLHHVQFMDRNLTHKLKKMIRDNFNGFDLSVRSSFEQLNTEASAELQLKGIASRLYE